MDSLERKKFWEKLCSFDGTNLEKEIEELKETIKLPNYIYRYRPINVDTIDALRNNKLYFSKSSYYDDPFDTYLHINYKTVYQQLIETTDTKENVINAFRQICIESGQDEEKVSATIEEFRKMTTELLFNALSSFLKSEIQPLIRNTSMSVCFSESGINETMWLKYADQYKGFCDIYSLLEADDANLLCKKQEKCKECGIAKYGAPIYPMYYSDTRYDATKYANKLAHGMFLKKCFPNLSDEAIAKQLDPCFWEKQKVTLIKSKCHEYDKEWRIIPNAYMKPPVMQEWIPYGVIIGLRTEPRYKRIIIEAAQSAGIKHIYQSFIDNNGGLEVIEITNEVYNNEAIKDKNE